MVVFYLNNAMGHTEGFSITQTRENYSNFVGGRVK